MTPLSERQQALLDWMAESSRHEGLTAAEIADVSGIDFTTQGRYDKCLADLKRMHKLGCVTRQHGRPARWNQNQ